MKRIACIGECMVELAERPDGTFMRSFGGDTLNTALYLARLGMPVDYVTALGNDPFSDEMMHAWTAEGIGTRLIPQLPDRLPGLYIIQTDATGERRFSYWRDSAPVRQLFTLPKTSAPGTSAPGTAAIEAALCQAGLIYLSGITLSLFDAESRDRLFDALARARQHGARIAFDTNFRPRGWPDLALARAVYDRAFRASDIVLASVEDHAFLHGSDEPSDVIDRLRQAEVSEIVVKYASPACHVIADGLAEVVVADTVQDVIDTTAAGDSFAAGYLAARRTGSGPAAAARVGHTLAGAVVRHRGAIIPRAAMPAITLTPEAS